MRARLQIDANIQALSVQRHLEQSRDTPTLLAGDPDVQRALQRTSEVRYDDALNRKFESIGASTNARVLYLIGSDGVTRAASNWRTPVSFVGKNYRFRPYFQEAIRDGSAEFFALGTVSATPGLYMARRVATLDGQVGVVVVKAQFDALEAQWSRSPEKVLVTDALGVVILTDHPLLRFRATRALSIDAISAIRESRQFGDDPNLAPLPMRLGIDAQERSLTVNAPVPQTSWTVWVQADTSEARAGAYRAGSSIGGLIAALGLGAIGVLSARWRRQARAKQSEAHARAILENSVRERTRDLDASNSLLQREVSERRRAEANLQTLQEELFQANQLTILGQIAASVAHEVNQPLAAIKMFAQNAGAFLRRNQLEEARANIAIIGELADRIGVITNELRSMSRRNIRPVERVAVGDAIDGALLLVGARIRAQNIRVERAEAWPQVHVSANKMRIEQVLINLLQNAADAVAATSDPTIAIGIDQGDGVLHFTVEDNGPGLSEEGSARLFTPFQSSKIGGLGLGLVISQDICREYGGQIGYFPSRLRGAGFRATFPVAP
jgi:two-component system C4-dicarboxylate transport sensor histidine kinase DctB